ncbi:hypothetical protein BDR04DRAFT_351188 [Suillus decipiens]|nr:hypothetical protein BDR04DRAFT_351188 [Suillus decipiens]
MPSTWVKPFATKRALYLSISPVGPRLILYTRFESIIFCPFGLSTASYRPIFSKALSSSSMAACHRSVSGQFAISSNVLGSSAVSTW